MCVAKNNEGVFVVAWSTSVSDGVRSFSEALAHAQWGGSVGQRRNGQILSLRISLMFVLTSLVG